ncbi:MAG: hypothetical protein ACYS21_10920, partial [Planctomycetota bacterium]
NYSDTLRVYHTSDWSLARTISLSRLAVSIAIDVQRGFLYLGGGYVEDEDFVTRYNPYLTQYNLATSAEAAVKVDPNAGVIGLSVDVTTGYIYMTTGRNNLEGGDNILVYDTALNRIDVITGLGNPTGLVVPAKDIGYNPLNLKKKVIEGVIGETAVDKTELVAIGHNFTYGIYFDNKDEDLTLTDVSIIDTLPVEIDFVTANDNGANGHYDPNTHTYTWLYSSVPPQSAARLELVAHVSEDTAQGTIIFNYVTVDSNETPPTTTRLDVIAHNAPLNLSKNIIGAVVDDIQGVDLNETLTYEICFDNNDNDFTATDVFVLDILPPEVDFVTADEDGVYGQYNPAAHTYTWLYSSLPPGSPICLSLVVRVTDDPNVAPPGTTITNLVVVDSNETLPSTTSVDVITYSNPLNLSKSIIGAVDGEVEWVDVDETITYSICFDNNDNDAAATNVSAVDTLPQEVSFVTADGDGVFGQYDPNAHTYEWSYESLGPGEAVCLELVVQVNQDAAPGATITNSVIVDSNETPPSAAGVDATMKYDPLNLSKSIVGAVEGEVTWVDVNETITYSICFDNNDNDAAAANVSIVDTLPQQVSFVTADGDGVFGQYDPNAHTYEWSYESLGPGEAVCLELVVQVNQDAASGVTITNSVIVDSNETPSSTASVNATMKYDPLNVSKSIVGAIEGQVKWVDVGETTTYSICFDNNDNDAAATNVSIVDTLPQEVSFVTADGDGVFGQYDPNAHTYSWSYESLEPGQAACLELVVQVNQNAGPGATITNSVILDSNETEPSAARVDATMKYNQLNLSKSVTGAVEGQVTRVDIDETFVYGIRVDNFDNDYAVTNVSIVDTLPQEVSFVSAEDDGTFGQYDPDTHTYTWSYPSLLPGTATFLELAV